MVAATGSNQTIKARSTATAFSFNASTNVLSAANFASPGNGSTLYGPNSSWSQYLRVGGNGNADTTNASVVATDGNLHLDARSGGYTTYINYYKGTGGIRFGNGASGYVGSITSAGNFSVDGTGTFGANLLVSTSGTGSSSSTIVFKRSGQSITNFGSYSGSWRTALQLQNNDSSRLLFLAPPEDDYQYGIIRAVNGGLKIDVGGTTSSTGINAISIDTAGVVTFPQGTVSGSITYATNSSKLYSTDAAYSYTSASPYYGYLTYDATKNVWKFLVSPATPSEVEVAYAVNLSTTRTNWTTNQTITAVVGQLAWKVNGNNHTIFDASAGTSPSGTLVSNTNSQVAWTATYPTLMGWNGSSTYGVRVDSARLADAATTVSSPDGDRNAGTKLPTTTPQAVRFDFVTASTTGTGGNYAGVMTYAPYTGTSASTGDASYQLAFGSTATNGSGIPQLNIRNGIDSTWNSWHTIIHSGNIGNYSAGANFSVPITATTQPFFRNIPTISGNYTVTTAYNEMSIGPITINSGVTVTVDSGATWTIV